MAPRASHIFGELKFQARPAAHHRAHAANAMGKKKGGAKKDGANSAAADDEDALLDLAIAENKVLKEKAVKAAVDAASTAAAALNKLPVFAIANREKKPLEFKVGDVMKAVFYADVAAAMDQLKTTKRESPDLYAQHGCDVITVGLGSAYKLACDGKAVIVPGVADLRGAGAPEGVQPMGIELPLFACMKMWKMDDSSKPVLPLFMSHADCAAQVAEANEAEKPDVPLEISILSLSSVVEHLAEPSSDSFAFVPPSASVEHFNTYVGSGVYMRKVEEPPDLEEGDTPPKLQGDDEPPKLEGDDEPPKLEGGRT